MKNNKRTPTGWNRIRVGEFLSELGERNRSADNNGLPVLSVTNKPGFVVSEEFFDRKVFSKDLTNYKVIRKGQFAYNPSRVNVGSIARLKQFDKGLLSPMYVIFETKEGLDGSYLDYWISSQRFRNLVKASTQGSVRDSLNFSALAEFLFNLPPEVEQKKIVSILACVDSVIDKTQAIINQTQTLKKGLMQELFTRGIPDRHKKFKKTEIGEMPEGWEVANLENISKNGINNGIFKKRHQFGRGALLVNVLDTYKSLCVDPSTLDRVEATKEEIKRYALDKGDLLFVRSYKAYSAATLTALGANKIIMHPMGELGPVDPKVQNEYNPIDQRGNPVGINVEDVASYIALIKEGVGIRHEDELVQAFDILAQKVHPLALGNVHRFYSQSRLIGKKLLKLHMPREDEHKINEIVDNLTSKLFYHGHPINRKEAKELNLKIEEPGEEVANLMWELYKEYENELNLLEPFRPVDLLNNSGQETLRLEGLKGVYIESVGKTDVFTSSFDITRPPLQPNATPQMIAQARGQVTVTLLRQGWETE